MGLMAEGSKCGGQAPQGPRPGGRHNSLAIAMCSVLPEGPFPENGTDGCSRGGQPGETAVPSSILLGSAW